MFPRMSHHLVELCQKCLGKEESPEIRSLTDIQKAVLVLVAERSASESRKAKNRIEYDLQQEEDLDNGLFEIIEKFLLKEAPLLVYFDMASLTPHLERSTRLR